MATEAFVLVPVALQAQLSTTGSSGGPYKPWTKSLIIRGKLLSSTGVREMSEPNRSDLFTRGALCQFFGDSGMSRLLSYSDFRNLGVDTCCCSCRDTSGLFNTTSNGPGTVLPFYAFHSTFVAVS